MKSATLLQAAGIVLSFANNVAAQNTTCSKVLKPSYSAPVVGSGWIAQLVATGLKKPRGIILDSSGHLLVAQQGTGIQRLVFNDNGNTCLDVAESTTVVGNSALNHGIALSNDGKTLFASSSEDVFAWSYDAASGKVSGDPRTVVENMGGTGHVSRTLLMSSNNKLLVSKGSGENVDDRARDKSSGVSQIRAFDMEKLPDKAYDFASQGTMLGWGLRNSVGIAQEPKTGGIFSVENSVDQLTRDGTDVHQDNPGEELNFHGFLNGSTENQGGNYGYPDCFAIWNTNIPDIGSMSVGSQFPPEQTNSLNDTTCNGERVSPRLTFQAHTAPLDMRFTPDGSEAYVTFHGSWNRDNPAGYKLSKITFSNGQPTESASSTKSTSDILSNPDNSACPSNCFRPVGLALDSQGRLFMSSDATGEIYVLQKVEMSATGSQTPSTSGTLVTPSSTGSGNAGSYGHAMGSRAYVGMDGRGGWGLGLTLLTCLLTGFGAWAVFPYVEAPARRA